MGLMQSKGELLYQQVNSGNIEVIKALRSQGAGLEWTDCEGKTPLILACMNPELYGVAKTLIELGANVNAYCRGCQAGTPLHHAAKRGLDRTVELLLSHGANALKINDDCQTPLDIARAKGCCRVVRAIEGHLCLFSGWLRELYGPSFLDFIAPQLLSRKVWVVILPCGSRNPRKPFKLELAIYACAQDAQPRTIIPLWKAHLDEQNLNQSEPFAVISNVSRMSRLWKRRRCIRSSQEAGCSRIKFAPASGSEMQQLQQFCNACRGIPQVVHTSYPFNKYVPAARATVPPSSEDEQLATAINASLQSASHERPPHSSSVLDSSTSSTNSTTSPIHDTSYSMGASTSKASGGKCKIHEVLDPSQVPVPSAPIEDAVIDNGPIHYPSIDMSPVESSSQPSVGATSLATVGKREDGSANSSCTICLDAPLEGACVPCGHMAGCMSCLSEIKAKKWGCPVCRANIDQVIRIYAV